MAIAEKSMDRNSRRKRKKHKENTNQKKNSNALTIKLLSGQKKGMCEKAKKY